MKKPRIGNLHQLWWVIALSTVGFSGVAMGGEVRDPKWQSAGTPCSTDGIGNVRMSSEGILEQCRSAGWVPLAPVAESEQVKEAKELVPAYLGKLYTVVDQPTIGGNKAVVHATLLGQSCDLTLMLHPQEFGNDGSGPWSRPAYWLVERQACVKLH